MNAFVMIPHVVFSTKNLRALVALLIPELTPDCGIMLRLVACTVFTRGKPLVNLAGVSHRLGALIEAAKETFKMVTIVAAKVAAGVKEGGGFAALERTRAVRDKSWLRDVLIGDLVKQARIPHMTVARDE